MEFSGIKFNNPPGANLCYSNACVNALMASRSLMAHVEPNHDPGLPCGICQFFSYSLRVGQLQPSKCHSTAGLKKEISKTADQFAGSK